MKDEARALELVEESPVEQRTDGDDVVALHKQVWRLPGDVPLTLVRKHRPGGPTRAPVLLVHGFAQNRYSWHTSRRSVSAWLAGQGWDVWNLELRGHGRSRRDGQLGAERFADYVADVQAVAEALPGPAFQVGHSLGGAAVYAAAAHAWELREQGRSARLPRGVIGIGALYVFGQANPWLGLLGRITHQLRDQPFMAAFQVRTRLFGHALGRLYGVSDIAGYGFPISGWWPGSMEPELLQERLTRGFDWTSVRVWQEMSRWAAEGLPEWDEVWQRTDVPLFVLAGDQDHLMPPDDARVAYDRSGSHDKELCVLDDWSAEVHWGHLDLVLGRLAPRHVWPRLHGWMQAR
ncbi:MAG: alpha/beta fold hydrolase [Alphaproteobacteria bacterium]|nr:alpha/beta fold hydrolase [Alphaproteobacteria bacterium]